MDEKEATVFATLAIQFVWCCGSVICLTELFFFFFAPRRNLGESLGISIWPFLLWWQQQEQVLLCNCPLAHIFCAASHALIVSSLCAILVQSARASPV